ncbi:hypothetical protein [Odoribacter splanchnicus]|uniref:hypothetical protein n=1 Tax=Odoribacter splanchnicus TaxID=28118 RepID=UPI00189BE6D6|nr:hypothetical protein [Odoribacter splanchnicus]
MTIVQQPDSLSFCGNLKDFIITGESELSFSLYSGSTILIAETYTAYNNKIIIPCKKVIEQQFTICLPDTDVFVQTRGVLDFNAHIGDTTVSFRVIKGGIGDAAEVSTVFLKSQFLTLQPQQKQTLTWQPEFLNYYTQEQCRLKLRAYFADGTNEEKYIADMETGKLYTIDLSFLKVNGKFEKQVGYYDAWIENTAGNRLTYIQRYILTHPKDNSQIYVFENTLGGLDSVCFTGLFSEKLETNGNITTINDESSDSDIDFSVIYEQNTGYIPTFEYIRWLRGFFLSCQRYHVTDSFRKIYIEESENTFRLTELNSYTFEFRYSLQNKYGFVTRNQEMLPELLEFPAGDKLFFLAPRLSEFPIAAIADDLVLPAQFSFENQWRRISIAAIIQAAISASIDATLDNIDLTDYWKKEELVRDELYLKFLDKKISSGYADKAGNSEKWNNKQMSELLDQPVRKTDSVQFKQVTADKITTDEIISDNFVSGPLGEGMNLIRRDSSGKSYLEIDKIFARYKAVFAALEIRKLTYAGGNYIFSPAGATCTMVEDKEGFYRCYFTADDGEKAVENLFRTDDFVQCRESNIKSGTYENISNRYYWRRCIATGDDYIDLSKSDCDTDSDIPAIGDSMVTIGNKTVSARQNAIIISVYGEGSPSFIQYKGINTFSLEGKAKIIISPDQNRFTGKFTFETGKDAEESIGDVQSNLDNLQVGETNLLDNSNKGWKNTGYPIATIYLGDYKPKQGEECTIVIKGKLGANKTSWGVYNSGGNVVLASFYPGGPDTDYIALKTFKWTLTPAIDNTFIRIYPMPNSVSVESEIEWVKLVLGNKTSLLWTPSINDQRQIAIDEAGKVVDGIQVGGVNILIGSTTGTGWTGYTEHKDTEFSIKDASTRESYIRSAMITIPGNKEIVVSFYAKHTGHQNYFDFYILPASYPEIDALLTSSYQSGTDWTYNEFKFTTPSDWGEGTLVYLRIDHNGMSDGSEFIISVKDVQIEYGNKATTYSVPESDRKEIAKQQGLEGGQEAVNGLQIGSQNLISKKMMLKWNEKNKDIAVWGQDEDGIYLAVNQKLLYNSIAEGTEQKDIFNSAIQFKQNTQNVLSFEYKSGRKIIFPVISFRICYTDGSYENVNLSGSDTTKTRTDYITDSSKTVDRISLNNSITNENVLIYNISLIEGNKPLQGFPVAEEDQTGANNVNLADGTKEFTLGVGSTNYTYKELYVSKIKPNTVYYVNAGNIQNLVGNPDRYSFVLYNKDVSTVLCPTLNADKNGGFLITYNNFTEQEGRLLCYAGIVGSTLGNSVKFTEVMLVEGFLPAPVWTPSFSEQQAEIKTITETLTEIKAENGEISLRINEVSERVEEAKQEAIDEAKEYTTIQTYRETEIDLRAEKWDQDTYYPVTIKLPINETRIEVTTELGDAKPKWSTHEYGFSMNCVWRSNGSGWGANVVNRIIEVFEYRFTKEIPDTTPVQYILPAGSIVQIISSSEELIYLRGGGRYLFKIGNNCVAVVHDSRYTAPDGSSVAPAASVIRPVLTNATKEELNAEINITKGLIENKVSLDVYNENDQLIKSDISNLQVSYNQISSTVSKIINGTQEISGVVTQSNFVTIFSSNKNALGQEVIESINVGGGGVTIDASRINLNGAISANGNVQITTDGKLIAVNGEFTGKITATEGEIAGLKLSNNGLRSSDFNASSKIGSCYAKNGFSVYASGSGVLAPSTGMLQAGIITATGDNAEIIGLEIIAKNTSSYATLAKITALKLRAIDYVDDSKKMAPTAALIVEEGVSIFNGDVEVNGKSTFNGAVYFKNVQNVNGKKNYYLCIDRSTGQLYYR